MPVPVVSPCSAGLADTTARRGSSRQGPGRGSRCPRARAGPVSPLSVGLMLSHRAGGVPLAASRHRRVRTDSPGSANTAPPAPQAWHSSARARRQATALTEHCKEQWGFIKNPTKCPGEGKVGVPLGCAGLSAGTPVSAGGLLRPGWPRPTSSSSSSSSSRSSLLARHQAGAFTRRRLR